MKAIPWPNRLGWWVEIPHGAAEVRNLATRLRAFVPAAPRREWITSLATGERKEVAVPQHRVCDFPLGTAPADAAAECARSGILRDTDGGTPLVDVPFVRLLALGGES